MDALADHLPWGVAALLFAGSLVVAWRFPQARSLMAAIRPALRRRVLRPPKLTVVPPPPPADENGEPAPGAALPTDPANPGGGPTGGMG